MKKILSVILALLLCALPLFALAEGEPCYKIHWTDIPKEGGGYLVITPMVKGLKDNEPFTVQLYNSSFDETEFSAFVSIRDTKNGWATLESTETLDCFSGEVTEFTLNNDTPGGDAVLIELRNMFEEMELCFRTDDKADYAKPTSVYGDALAEKYTITSDVMPAEGTVTEQTPAPATDEPTEAPTKAPENATPAPATGTPITKEGKTTGTAAPTQGTTKKTCACCMGLTVAVCVLGAIALAEAAALVLLLAKKRKDR